jgi:hypothetical protein
MKKPKMTKQEKVIAHLEGLLARRAREVRNIQARAAEEIAKVERRNAFTKFQLESVRKGEWPL